MTTLEPITRGADTVDAAPALPEGTKRRSGRKIVRATWLGSAVALAAYVLVPLQLGDFELSILVFAGIYAIATLGLNLLTGFTGQVSVGHAFFMAIGAYTAARFGAEQGLPLPVWLLLAAAIGGLVGAAVGPFALRLKGLYLLIVSVALVYVGLHVWKTWESLTGGAAGISGQAPAALGPIDFNELAIGSTVFTKQQGWFWLVWAVLALVLLLASNIVQSRPGRAMQAIRDRDAAAAVIGVAPARYKVGAFAVSSAMASASGALYFGYVEYASPEQWDLHLSIQIIAMMIVGGSATISGAVLGAVCIMGLPRLIEELSTVWPFLDSLGISLDQLNIMVYGLLLVVFLIFQPSGIAGLVKRLQTVPSWLRTSPRSDG